MNTFTRSITYSLLTIILFLPLLILGIPIVLSIFGLAMRGLNSIFPYYVTLPMLLVAYSLYIFLMLKFRKVHKNLRIFYLSGGKLNVMEILIYASIYTVAFLIITGCLAIVFNISA